MIDVFLKNPPIDFEAILVSGDNSLTPAFLANFDLLTTIDDKSMRDRVRKIPFSRYFLNYKTIFVGTTVSEYAVYPQKSDYKQIIASLLHEMRKRKAQWLIVKDIPQDSPLLSMQENEAASMLFRQLHEAGFQLLEGQALAYVPIDFKSIDEYMARLSKTRRKEFRKKLKQSAHVQVEEVNCGGSLFFDEAFLDTMYRMYENVFRQSDIHFDVLSKGFFRDLLQNAGGGGKVFLYKADGRLIGYNICFVEGKRLVDKYVGFVYPEARESNLYFISWFYNLEYALKTGLECYIAGWTDPEVKASLGAKFTLTRHAVYIGNPIIRNILKPFKHLFESDSKKIDKDKKNGAENA